MFQAFTRQKQKQNQPNNILTVTKGMFHDYLGENAKQELNPLLKEF